MAGLVPAIHDFGCQQKQDVDARHKAGHDSFGTRCRRVIAGLVLAISLRRAGQEKSPAEAGLKWGYRRSI
jgi:hypothetical protein